jgi:hypothetical protein
MSKNRSFMHKEWLKVLRHSVRPASNSSRFWSRGYYLKFKITQVRVCPALIVPVASDERGAVCLQSPPKVGVNPGGTEFDTNTNITLCLSTFNVSFYRIDLVL